MLKIFITLISILAITTQLTACSSDESPFKTPNTGTSGGGGGSNPGGGAGGGGGSTGPTPFDNVSLVSAFSNSFLGLDNIKKLMISDDGGVVAIVSTHDFTGNNPDGVNQVFIINGASVNQITEFTTAAGGIPTREMFSLSGDGSLLAFFSTYDSMLGTNADNSSELYTINTSTGTITQVTNDGASHNAGVNTAAANGCSVNCISLNTDGSILIFSSTLDYTTGNAGGFLQIFSMTTAGGTATQITGATANHTLSELQFSGDGSRVTFIGGSDWGEGGGNADGNEEVYTINFSGLSLVQITSTPLSGTQDNINPRISNDGDTIIFGSEYDVLSGNTSTNKIFSYNVTSTTTTEVDTGSSFVVGNPINDRWDLSGDGTQVSYETSNCNSGTQRYEMIQTSVDPISTTLDDLFIRDIITLVTIPCVHETRYVKSNLNGSNVYFLSNIEFLLTTATQSTVQIHSVNR